MSKKIPAVAYYRMSSDRQEASIGDQRTAVEQYAKDKGYKILWEYTDEGISGSKSAERAAFQQLISDAPSGKFKAVLCWDQDRFSRFPVLEANHYWYLLDSVGVHLSTVAQGRLNFEDLGEWLKASITQHGKAEYLRDLARNTARGLRKRQQAGQWIGAAPLGYHMKDDGYLELGDTDKVALVQRIFRLRFRGYGLLRIAKKLNSEEIQTPRNTTWSTQSIRHILQRDAYLGHTVTGKHSRARFECLVEGGATVKNTHTPIIDQATWDAVQRMKKTKRKTHTRNGNEGARLSNTLICGNCGKPMYPYTSGNGPNQYICSSYHNKGLCGRHTVHQDKIEAAVFSKIREQLLLGSQDKLQAKIQKLLDNRTEQQPDTRLLEVELAALDLKIAKAADRLLMVDDRLVEDLQKGLLALKARRELMADEVAHSNPRKQPPSAKEIAAKLWQLDQELRTASPTTVRHLLKQILQEVRLDFEMVRQTAKRKYHRCRGGTVIPRLTEGVQRG
jgi:DNA invertase Pin-like site-specific DNA recombinase